MPLYSLHEKMGVPECGTRFGPVITKDKPSNLSCTMYNFYQVYDDLFLYLHVQLKKSTSVAERWENFTSALEPFQSKRTQVKRFQMKELDDVISGLEGEISELEVSIYVVRVYVY